MKKSTKFICAGIITLAVIICAGMYYYNANKPTPNSDDAVGNTAGNLINGGLFCEYNGKIYFANPYDHNYLYVMDSDCSNARMLNSDSVAYLNIYNDKIYYVKNNYSEDSIGTVFRSQLVGVFVTDLEGQNAEKLYNDLSGVISICGNYLYYQHYDSKTALTLHKLQLDTKKDNLVSTTPHNPSSVDNGRIYFANTDNKNVISCLDPKSDYISKFYEANAYLPISSGSYIYYIDIAKGYSLVRLNKSNNTIELLYGKENSKVINYNIYNDKIFFQLEGDENPGLYRMNANGTQIEYIATGNLTNIHCTSQYTFFQYYDNQGVLYRIPTTGAATYPDVIRIEK